MGRRNWRREMLLGSVGGYPGMEKELKEFMNQQVEVTTTTGAIQGRVTYIGNAHMELTEAAGTVVLVPYENFSYITRT